MGTLKLIVFRVLEVKLLTSPLDVSMK